VGRCANPKVCARMEHLYVIEHLCLEIPQKKATPPTIFRFGYKNKTEITIAINLIIFAQ